MSTEDNKALVRRAFDGGFNQWNLAVLDELSCPDFVYHNTSMTFQGLEV